MRIYTQNPNRIRARGRCPTCRRLIIVRNDGNLRSHKRSEYVGNWTQGVDPMPRYKLVRCRGSDHKPLKGWREAEGALKGMIRP